MRLKAALIAVRGVVNHWTKADEKTLRLLGGPALEQSLRFDGRNPLQVIRDIVATCPDEGPAQANSPSHGSVTTGPAEQAPVDRHMVALIPGIRTQAVWAEKVARALEESAGVTCHVLKFGYFDLFRFLLPWTREGPIVRIRRKLTALQDGHEGASLSVVAHSFGTYIVCRLLLEEPSLRLRRLVLCGSVVPTDYPWERVASQIESAVLNDCGTRDIWPILASGIPWGYGASGTFGFGDPKVRDRFHPLDHGGYFERTFVSQYWVSYIATGAIARTEWEIERPPVFWWQSVLALGWLRWPVIAGLLFFGWAIGRHVFPLRSGPTPSPSGVASQPGSPPPASPSPACDIRPTRNRLMPAGGAYEAAATSATLNFSQETGVVGPSKPEFYKFTAPCGGDVELKLHATDADVGVKMKAVGGHDIPESEGVALKGRDILRYVPVEGGTEYVVCVVYVSGTAPHSQFQLDASMIQRQRGP